MHTVLVARKALVGALVALAVLAGALFIAASKASASRSQCSENTVCVWEQPNYEGRFSWWPEENWGCHTHVTNTPIRSTWNRTFWGVRYGGFGVFGGGSAISNFGPVYGEICWPE